jgi:hypothetical protein
MPETPHRLPRTPPWRMRRCTRGARAATGQLHRDGPRDLGSADLALRLDFEDPVPEPPVNEAVMLAGKGLLGAPAPKRRG